MAGIAHKVNKIYVGKPNPKYYNIPSEYTQLEYIQSDMINYFDSGVKVSSGLKIVADFQLIYKQYGYEFSLFGTRDTNGRIRCCINTKNQFVADNNTYSQSSDIYIKTTVTALPENDYTSSDQSIYIFAQHQDNLPFSIFGICKLYSLKIYNNNILIKDYIPVLRKFDNEIGLYDIINNQFLEKVSSIPSEYQQVEYLESTGTQYIDTEYKAVTNTGFFTKFSNNDEIGTSNSGVIFGACNSSYTGYYLETWTNSSNKGGFRKVSTLYDPGLIKDTILIRNHSTVTNTLTNSDTSYISTNTTSNTTPVSMYLFACNKENSGAVSKSKTKLYLLIFVEQYTPIHIYVPVINISENNKPGLYDIISQKLLVNSGQGEFLTGQPIQAFTAGQEVYPEVAIETTNKYIGGVHPLSKNLPQAYQQVEYIQNDGFKHIDTGIETNENLTAEVDFQVAEYKPGLEACICGIYNSTSRMRVLINSGAAFFASNGTFSQTTNLNARTTATFKPETGYASPDGTLWIFAQNTYENHQKNAIINKIRIYSLKMYNNNELIRDFVPAKRKNDNILGLYDVVNNIFYTPTEKISNEYQRIKYIESTGTQYINTNYNPVTLTGSYCEFQCPTIGTTTEYDTIFGSYDNNNTSSYQLNTYNSGRFSRNNYNYNISISTGVEKIAHSKNQNILLSTNNTSTSVDSTTLTDNYPIYIFANNSNDTIDNISKSLKLYHLVLFENSRVMHDYIPVIRILDNKPGLYDEVNGEFLINNNQSGSDFLYNENIDNFTCGTEINSVAHSITNVYIGV